MQHQIRQSNEALTLKRVFLVVLSAWFAWVSVVGSPAFAQSLSTDFESPVIEHEPTNEPVEWGEVQVFEATVVDNEEIKQVRLYYRFSGDQDFTEIPMQRLASTSSFTARIDTSQYGERKDAIEYYIRAEDVSDNLVLSGFAFEPLTRTFLSPIPAAPAASTTPDTSSALAGDSSAEKKGINWLYVALGVVLLGGIASGAGGGGGGTEPDPTMEDGNCEPSCTVTLTIGTP